MIQFPRPTRAEATDVANAVLDGTDAVMLSGETASGEFPVEACSYMRRICVEAEVIEASTDMDRVFDVLRRKAMEEGALGTSEVVSSYSVRSARDLRAECIITITETGNTARLVAKYKPSIPVIAVTNNKATANFLLLSKFIYPVLVPSVHGTDKLVEDAMNRGKALGLCKTGSLVVVITGVVEGKPGNSNNMKIITVP